MTPMIKRFQPGLEEYLKDRHYVVAGNDTIEGLEELIDDIMNYGSYVPHGNLIIHQGEDFSVTQLNFMQVMVRK